MAEKIGRNDPCPCGSGKKMKQCCGGKGKKGLRVGGRAREVRVLTSNNSSATQLLQQGVQKSNHDYQNLMERSFGEALHVDEDAPPTPGPGDQFEQESLGKS